MKVTVEDGTFASFVARPAMPRVSGGAVVVLHESCGLNADIRTKCEALATCGFLAIAPDLFWRDELGSDKPVKLDRENGSGPVHATPFDHDLGLQDIAAVVRAVRDSEITSGKIGVMGFGLGGFLAYLTAARLPIDAAVVYYGPRIEQFLAEAIKISVPLLMHVGEDDSLIPPSVVAAIVGTFGHKSNIQILRYPASRHAFARENGVHFNGEAAELAQNRTAEFLNRALN